MESEIKKGLKVEIITTKDKKKVIGIVEDVGIKTEGKKLLVRLKSGEIGRVQRIIDEKQKTEVEELVRKGESQKVEFKSEVLWSLNYNTHQIKESKSYELHTFKQKASKVIIAKSIAALMNNEGGVLVLGVKEKKENSNYEVVGIEKDLEKLKEQKKDFSLDGYKRMIIDEIIRPYFPPKIYNKINYFLEFKFENFEGKNVCLIKINPSEFPVFLSLEGRKIFMIRTETQTRQIQDEELVEYCMERFS
ncbi:MAG: putative DNA binding domain-containing protein [Candidatus Pacearchaeota archaeon]